MYIGVFLEEKKHRLLKTALEKALVAEGHLCTMMSEKADIIITDKNKPDRARNGVPVTRITQSWCGVAGASGMHLSGDVNDRVETIFMVINRSYAGFMFPSSALPATA